MQDFDIIEGLDNMQMDAVMVLLKTIHCAAHRSEQQERRSRNILFATIHAAEKRKGDRLCPCCKQICCFATCGAFW